MRQASTEGESAQNETWLAEFLSSNVMRELSAEHWQAVLRSFTHSRKEFLLAARNTEVGQVNKEDLVEAAFTHQFGGQSCYVIGCRYNEDRAFVLVHP